MFRRHTLGIADAPLEFGGTPRKIHMEPENRPLQDVARLFSSTTQGFSG